MEAAKKEAMELKEAGKAAIQNAEEKAKAMKDAGEEMVDDTEEMVDETDN